MFDNKCPECAAEMLYHEDEKQRGIFCPECSYHIFTEEDPA